MRTLIRSSTGLCKTAGDGIRLCAAAMLLLALQDPPAAASAWNEPQGEGLFIAEYTFTGGSRYFNGTGRLSPAAAYAKHEGFGYLEYGVTDWLMAVIKPDAVATSIETPAGPSTPAARYDGLGSSEVGAQLHLLAYGPALLAAQATFRLPATTAQTNPALVGNTSRDIDARILAGISFTVAGLPAFLDAQAAYRFRSSGAPDEWHADLTLGLRPLPKLLLLLQSTTTVPTSSGTPWFPASLYTKLGAALVYDLTPRWSIELGLFQTLAGIDALRERGILTAVWYRF